MSEKFGANDPDGIKPWTKGEGRLITHLKSCITSPIWEMPDSCAFGYVSYLPDGRSSHHGVTNMTTFICQISRLVFGIYASSFTFSDQNPYLSWYGA